MKRKWEVIIGMAGMVLSVLFLGGFSLTMTSMDTETYKETVFPILQEGVSSGEMQDSLEAMNVLAIWFGITLILVLAFVIVATAFIWRNLHPRWAGVLYLVAGFSTLIGTQFIAFPIAFLFFLAGALCLLRKGVNVSKKGEGYVSNHY
jgi:di/tricarboxylate transporter